MDYNSIRLKSHRGCTYLRLDNDGRVRLYNGGDTETVSRIQALTYLQTEIEHRKNEVIRLLNATSCGVDLQVRLARALEEMRAINNLRGKVYKLSEQS